MRLSTASIILAYVTALAVQASPVAQPGDLASISTDTGSAQEACSIDTESESGVRDEKREM